MERRGPHTGGNTDLDSREKQGKLGVGDVTRLRKKMVGSETSPVKMGVGQQPQETEGLCRA